MSTTTITAIARPPICAVPRHASRHRAALVALASVIAASCGTKDAADSLQPSGAQGRVRFVNVITDTTRGRVNAILEQVPFGVNLTYAQSTPAGLATPSTALYSAILTGSRSLVLKRTADTSTTVATVSFTVSDNQDRTIYAIGGAASSAVTSFLTTDDNSAPPAGQTRVRVVHLSPTAGTVDIFVTPPGADLALQTPTLANVALQSASAYLAVPAGTYQVRAVPSGTAPGFRATSVVINVASLVLTAGTVRTIVAADNNVGGAPLRAFVLSDQ